MPFFQIERIRKAVTIVVTLLVVCIAAGCVINSGEKAKTSKQVKPETSKKIKAVNTDKRQLKSIRARLQNKNIDIILRGNQKLVYTSMKQSFPFGIAVYLPATEISSGFKAIIPDNNDISDLVVKYADKEKSTIKIEILLDRDFDYEVIEKSTYLKIVLSMEGDKLAEASDLSSDTKASEEKNIQKATPKEKISVSAETATLTNIEFHTKENGRSDIIVQTDHPVKYDIRQHDSNYLYLELYNTIVPDHHKRPILTQYFKSAVKSLIPEQVSGKKKTARIKIETREQVPYRIVQKGNEVLLFFDPSTIEPPVFKKAEIKADNDIRLQTAETSQEQINKASSKQSVLKTETSIEEDIFGSKKVYTGEKIQLDFYETDIKNVFRILRSVGKTNFAIDKNVSGKVTLTLEDPVPWDQVLDLVLKMNNLGMKQEGNVIRIATLDTLKKEKKIVEESITAKKKSLEQRKSFEPLVTEYIPINYSDAQKDIEPHITKILSKERGKISVDERTNMIIITDVQEKIDQAKEIIYRLDQVTPQIMIEAKVVEVTKSFTQELGVGLSISNRESTVSGFIKDFDVSLNHPVVAPSQSIDLSFFRLFGSKMTALNAKLSASEIKGDVKVISSPRILTLDNKTAKIKQGLEYAYLERDDTGGSSVSFKSIDLLLEVTPHVTPDKRISMNVYLTKNDIDSITNGIPSLSTNEAETELLVNNNDTIVIGGIVKTSENESSSGVPILSDIPLLGRLFRTDIDADKRNELLIFITPSIVQLDQKRNSFSSQSK